jgi:2,3,4,5-tetrahydropyridine-2,6-dicarboxylate N-succinyltransferase
MTHADLAAAVAAAWERRDTLTPDTRGADRDAVEAALALLDSGETRVASRDGDGLWTTQQWLKQAVLLSFRLSANELMLGAKGGPTRGVYTAWDKVPLKTQKWDTHDFAQAGFRMVPGAIVRRGAYIAKNAVLMPCFVNIGAFVDEGTMVDTWSTVGSCAQIGKNVHLSGGVGIGGVLEPLQANPTIIEDDCFIGARSEVVEGVIVGTGSVLSMGVFISANTRIVDRETGQFHVGKVPPYSVVHPGTMGGGPDRPARYCVIITKTVDERTRSKTSINELLRD